MDIVYLDQNKWIELAQIRSGAVQTGPLVDLYVQLQSAVRDGRVLFPLSASHVLETSKRNDPKSRQHVAETQATFSKGLAYRSRASRLRREIWLVMHKIFGVTPVELPSRWFLGQSFFDAFEQLDASISDCEEVQKISRILASISPADLYLDYMNGQDDRIRRMAHASLTEGVTGLTSRIEVRRETAKGINLDLRRRAYFAQLFLDHQELFISIADGMGYSYEQVRSNGTTAIKALVEEVPTLHVEAELASRLEAEPRRLKSNDVFDVQAFYTAIPYSSRVVGEKASVARARQAKLDVKYNVVLSHSLSDLFGVYS